MMSTKLEKSAMQESRAVTQIAPPLKKLLFLGEARVFISCVGYMCQQPLLGFKVVFLTRHHKVCSSKCLYFEFYF